MISKAQTALVEFCKTFGSQKHAAEVLGFSAVELNHYVKGRRRPTFERAFEIEQIAGIPCGDWFRSDL